VAWVGVIALESTPLFGTDRTSGPLHWIYEHLLGPVSTPQWLEIHHYIRKTGHFLGYGLTGLVWLRAWWMTLPRSSYLIDAMLALLGTGLIAIVDELHQSLLPNRTGMPSDVLLDCCGAILLQLVVYIFVRAFYPDRLVRPV
jgi:VanZ family protein